MKLDDDKYNHDHKYNFALMASSNSFYNFETEFRHLKALQLQ